METQDEGKDDPCPGMGSNRDTQGSSGPRLAGFPTATALGAVFLFLFSLIANVSGKEGPSHEPAALWP